MIWLLRSALKGGGFRELSGSFWIRGCGTAIAFIVSGVLHGKVVPGASDFDSECSGNERETTARNCQRW
jgi:hypothetical protein